MKPLTLKELFTGRNVECGKCKKTFNTKTSEDVIVEYDENAECYFCNQCFDNAKA